MHAAGTVITALVPPQDRRLDLFVRMTTYRGNPTGSTIKRVTLVAREDWARTAAFVLDKADLTEGRRTRVNVRGREPAGIIEPGAEYEAVRTRIIDGLTALRGPASEGLEIPFERVFSGNHRPEGIVLAWGRGVRGGGRLAASIVDVCPTVLYVLGVPCPADLDGRRLTDLFTDRPVAHVRAGTAAVAHGIAAGGDGADPYSGDDRAIVEDRLRKLRYLD